MKKKLAGMLSLLLVLSTLFTACGKPGGSGKKPKTTDEPGFIDAEPDWSGYESVGKSDAFSRNVENGVTISAEKNALYKDTEISVVPVNDDTIANIGVSKSKLLEYEKVMHDAGIFGFASWEVDAGLESDEHLPGGYKMTVDLSEFDVPKSMYDTVRFYRINDDGEIYEYQTELDGSKATFESNQNCIITAATVVEIAVLYGVLRVGAQILNKKATAEVNAYYAKSIIGPCTLERKTIGGSYKLVWLPEDMGVKNSVWKKMKKIEEQHIADAKEDHQFDDMSFSKIYACNLSEAEDLKKSLEADEEYMGYIKMFSEAEIVNKTIKSIDTAYHYLKTKAKVDMPKYTVNFYLQRGLENLGEAVECVGADSYINVGVNDTLIATAEEGGNEWDNFLLTITHELFHICQENYNLKYVAKSEVFDEMAAVWLESEALDYYKNSGVFTGDSLPGLTWEGPYAFTFNFTMDGQEGGDNNGRHGYALAKFVKFLKEKTKVNVTAKMLQDSRSYYTKTAISEPLKVCFGLTEDEFDTYFCLYCAQEKETIGSDCSTTTDWTFESDKIENGKSKHIETNAQGAYVCVVNEITLSKNSSEDSRILIIPDDDFRSAYPNARIQTTNDSTKTSEGIMIEDVSHGNAGYVEIVVGKDAPAKKTSGYTVYSILAPDKPEAFLKDGLVLKLPAATEIYSKGYLKGFILTITVDGVTEERLITADYFGKQLTMNMNNIFGFDVSDNDSVSVKYTPYTYDASGELLMCAESPVLEIEEKEPETTAEPPKNKISLEFPIPENGISPYGSTIGGKTITVTDGHVSIPGSSGTDEGRYHEDVDITPNFLRTEYNFAAAGGELGGAPFAISGTIKKTWEYLPLEAQYAPYYEKGNSLQTITGTIKAYMSGDQLCLDIEYEISVTGDTYAAKFVDEESDRVVSYKSGTFDPTPHKFTAFKMLDPTLP